MLNSAKLQDLKGFYQRPTLTSQQIKKLKRLIEQNYGHISKKRRAILMDKAFGLSDNKYPLKSTISYTPLSKFVGEIMREDNYNRETAVGLLREMGDVERERPSETFLYGGCWHGNDPEKVDRLFETRVDLAFFSDITGSDRVEESKRIFYNEIVNPGMEWWKKGRMGNGRKMEEMKFKLKRSYIKLMEWSLKLEYNNYSRFFGTGEFARVESNAGPASYVSHALAPSTPSDAAYSFHNLFVTRYSGARRRNPSFESPANTLKAHLSANFLHNLSVADIFEKIRMLVDKNHPGYIKNHGEWMATLPKKVREKILKLIKDDTIDFINILGKLRRRGTRVIVVEGNWDNEETLKMIAEPFDSAQGKGDMGNEGGEGDRITEYFDTKSYLKKHGFEFYDKLKTIPTKTSFHILVPFFWLRNMDELLKSRHGRVRFKNLKLEVEKEKRNGKTVIIYAHGVPYPSMHDRGDSHLKLSEDNRIVSDNLRQLMVMFRPHEVIYPHYHTAENFNLVARVNKKGAPLVKNVSKFNMGNRNLAVIDYVPFRDIAIKKIADRFNLPARVV